MPMAYWFYEESGQRSGPLSDEDLHAVIDSGRLDAGALLWREGMPSWVSLAQFLQDGGLPGFLDGGRASALEPRVSRLAIASLACGVLGLLTGLYFPGIPAVILGHMAFNRMKAAPSRLTGQGLALGGLLCGYLCLCILGRYVWHKFSGAG